MEQVREYFKESATYQLYKMFANEISVFISTLGEIVIQGLITLKYIFSAQINWKDVIEQSSRFGVSSLPITISIVSMTSIIVAMQVAGEMVKQGGGNYVGMMVALLTVRETGIIMSGFAIISMIGSSLASELATMKVTDQIDAIRVLNVDPIKYLFVPRIIAGTLMMPPVLIIASTFGILGGALASTMTSELSYKAYFSSVWSGLYIYDIKVAIAKAFVYGFTIALISCTCGYIAKGGAKGVGIATTKAVVWSFVAIVIWDLIFSIAFFF
ncbi:MAG: MlaE family ABC transporter permease [Candidatus Gastranaerophilaceae bacterium]